MTAHIHLTVHKACGIALHARVLDAYGVTAVGVLGTVSDTDSTPVKGEMAFALDVECCEQSLVFTVESGQSLWVGEGEPPVSNTSELAAAQSRISELEQAATSIAAKTVSELKISEDKLAAAQSRIDELETQLAAKSSKVKGK